MGRHGSNNGGGTKTELLLVMGLLIFFGTASFAMMVAGQQTSQQLIEKQAALSETRTAYAYITTRLRQHDETDRISIRVHPQAGTPALVIEEEYFGEALETWVYLSEGYLREVLIMPGGSIHDDISFPIAQVDEFQLAADALGQGIVFEVMYEVDGEEIRRGGFYYLKSSQAAH